MTWTGPPTDYAVVLNSPCAPCLCWKPNHAGIVMSEVGSVWQLCGIERTAPAHDRHHWHQRQMLPPPRHWQIGTTACDSAINWTRDGTAVVY